MVSVKMKKAARNSGGFFFKLAIIYFSATVTLIPQL
jgi:hypothetical protein